MDLQTSIGVYDAFSEPLRNMSNALNLTISSFENLQDTSSNAVNLDSLMLAQKELRGMEDHFDQIGEEITTAQKKQKEFDNEIRQSEKSATGLLSTFKSIAVAVGAAKMFREGFDVFTGFEQSIADLKAVTQATDYQMEALTYQAKMMGETTVFTAGQSAQAMKELGKGGLEVYEIIQGIPDVLDLAVISGMSLEQAAGSAVDIMKGFNLAADDMQRVVDLVAYTSSNATTDIGLMSDTFTYAAKIADTFNASIEETSALIGMMSTAAKGSRAGMTLRSGFGALASPTEKAQKWADQLDVEFVNPATNSLNSITEIVDDLAVGFNRLTDAQQIQAAQDIFGESAYAGWLTVIQEGKGAMSEWLNEFETSAVDTASIMKETMLATTDGILQIHKSEVESIWINFYEGLADTVVADAFLTVLEGMRTVLSVGLTLATGVIIALGYGIEFVTSALEVLLPFVVAAGIAYAVLNAHMLTNIAMNAADALGKIVSAIHTKILAMEHIKLAFAVMVATYQTQGLAAAMALLPITWVIAGIVIIIGVVYAGVAAFNKFADASISATGIIMGSFAVAGAFIMNLVFALVDFVWKAGLRTINGVISFAEFLANVFINPVSAIATLFVDLGDHVLSILESIASAIDFIFKSNLSNAVSGWRKDLQGWAESHIQENAIKLKRVDVDHGLKGIDYGSAWESGYNLGEKIGNKAKEMFSFGTGDFDMNQFMKDQQGLGGADLNAPGGLGDMLGNIGDPVKDIAGNTKGINDKLSATQEDIKFLRDLAASDIVNRFTSNEIRIEMSNDFKVDNELDLDGVASYLADSLEENIEIRMEGA